VSLGEWALHLANVRLAGGEPAPFFCARCYRRADVSTLVDGASCPQCGARLFVRLDGGGRVRSVRSGGPEKVPARSTASTESNG
jgi:DNA-directed RNA polymerase subunit RPC12/RpoP